MVRTRISNAKLVGCKVYGLSAWDLQQQDAPARISSLEVTPPATEAPILVDSLEAAQVVHSALGGAPFRDAINEMTSKGVLLLGRFSPSEQFLMMKSLKNALRQQQLIPIMFDFERPSSRDLRESILMLASLSRFIIVDLSAPRSVPAELEAVLQGLVIPVVPILSLIHI